MEQVFTIKRELEKTVPTKNQPNQNQTKNYKKILELLISLESIPMTLEILQSTHIGKTVNIIRKAVRNADIDSLGKSMVRKWKKLIEESAPSPATNSNSNSGVSNSTSNITNNTTNLPNMSNNVNNNNNNNGSNNDVKTTPQTNSIGAQSSQSTQKTTTTGKPPAPVQTHVPATDCEVRLKCRQLLCESLKKPLSKDLKQECLMEEDVLAARIEESIFREFRATDMKYKTRVRSRVANLGDNKNPYLRFNVLRGDIAPERIAKMTAEEMASDELKKEREKFTKEAINDHQMALTAGTTTSEIKCPACKKFNVTYNQVQTRSADEPMTTFCYCNECGKRWKFC